MDLKFRSRNAYSDFPRFPQRQDNVLTKTRQLSHDQSIIINLSLHILGLQLLQCCRTIDRTAVCGNIRNNTNGMQAQNRKLRSSETQSHERLIGTFRFSPTKFVSVTVYFILQTYFLDSCSINGGKRWYIYRAFRLVLFKAVAYRGGGVSNPPKFRRPSKIVPNSTRL